MKIRILFKFLKLCLLSEMNRCVTTVLAAGLAFMFIFSIGASANWPDQVFAQEPEANEHAEFVANIEYIKGHLAQAIANKQADQTDLAVAHAGHPVVEVYSLIEKEITEHDADLNTKLKQALTSLANDISDIPATDTVSRVNEIELLLDQAKSSVVGQNEGNDPGFNAMVVAFLLETAEHEYEEGVQDGKIVQTIEYQDASAFIVRADSTFTAIKQQVPVHEAQKIEELFATLDSDVKANSEVENIEASVDGIKHELDELFDLEDGGNETDGQKIIDKINELLDESIIQYKAGNFQEAKSLAVEAYLDNFEYIESDINEDNPDLMKKIEVNMRENLVQMIDSKQPESDVESYVNMIKADLETARTVVVPEFPMALVAMAAAMMAVIIVGGRFRGTILFRDGNRAQSL